MSRENAAQGFVRIDPATGRSLMRRKAMGLTEQERRMLLVELAEVAAELDALNERVADVAARLSPPPVRLARPA